MLRQKNWIFWWAPALLAALYVVVLLTSGGLLDHIYGNADAASAPVIAELMASADPGRVITLGDYAWYEPLWIMRGTAWMPEHYTVWLLLPFLMWVVSVVLAYAAVRQLTKARQPAFVAGALVVCGGVAMRGAFWTPNAHGLVIPHMLVLGVALVWAVAHPQRLRGIRGLAAAGAIGLITAVGTTDKLLLVYGVAPLLLAAAVLGATRRDWLTLRLAALVAVTSLIGGKLLVGLGQDAGINTTNRAFDFVAPNALVAHLELIMPAAAQIVAQSPFGTPLGGRGGLSLIAGLIALFVAVVVARFAIRSVVRAVFPDGLAGGIPAMTPRTDVDQPADASTQATSTSVDDAEPDTDAEAGDAPAVWIAAATFWAGVILAALFAWMFTSAPVDVYTARYLVPAWIGVCVLGPVLAERLDVRWVATVAAIAICGAAVVQFEYSPAMSPPEAPTVAETRALEAFGKEHGVTRGYAPYWSAAPITWHSRFKLTVVPVLACPSAATKNCRYFLHTISSWYTPRNGPSMLIMDGRLAPPAALDPASGKPLATKKVGAMTAYIFDHDIARELAG